MRLSPPPCVVSSSFQMVLVAIFSETGFFDYCAVKVRGHLDSSGDGPADVLALTLLIHY